MRIQRERERGREEKEIERKEDGRNKQEGFISS